MAKILIVDNDELQIRLVRLSLEPAGHIVDALQDSEHVVEVIAHQNLDLLILNCDLPKESGVDLLRELRARITKFPVLVLTGWASQRDADLVDLARDGADDYLTKPHDPIDLQIKVESLLKKTSARP
ncbi:response regulator transcription factor [Sphingomicrobium marinum]|uniref:response regulator transcription factor n=1 Tax=Sphingomicrobium marinum TaxID=1227950 RepID=UPI00223EC682|nr:response regulator [Sphingomicrobium marinum]